MNRKTIALFLALLMLSANAVGCAGGEGQTDTTPSDTTAVDNVQTETETERPYADLPETDMGGADMPVFIAYNVEGADTLAGVSKNEFGATELTGEAINDARYTRNQTVGELYNCVISSYDYNVETSQYCIHDPVIKTLDNLILAGDNNYAFMLLPGYSTCKMAINGTLTDLLSYEHIDLTAPWWDQKANENLTVMDTLYYSTGDIATADNDATCTVLFNKTIATNFDIPDMYQTVKDGKWTLDLFLELSELTSVDTNGDGEYTRDDQYGVIMWDDIAMAVVNSADVKCAKVGEDGKIALTLNTERTIDALGKFVPFGRDKTQCFQYQRVAGAGDQIAVEMFSNNQSLFFMQLMQIVPKLRDMEADFGIIPFPKYNESQSEYFNTVGSWHSVFFCMPISTNDPVNSSIIAEALACEGMYTVTEAYYDMTLKSKSARDEDSAAMLDIIFETRVYDLGWYYQFGMYNEEVMNLYRSNKTAKEFSSMYAAKEKSALAEVEKANNAYAEAVAGK